MKEYIKKLAKGEFEYYTPVLERIEPIAGDVVEDSKTAGALKLFSDARIYGTAYSPNTRFKTSGDFSGNEPEITFSVDAAGLKAGEKIEGELVIVSSAGEFKTPFSFEVIKKAVYAGNIKVEDLRSFTVLALRDPDSAVRIFETPEFRAVVLRDDTFLNALYDKLMPSDDAAFAMDNFLEGAGALENREGEPEDSKRQETQIKSHEKHAAPPFKRVWKRIKAELIRGYLDFRMKKIPLTDWCRKALLRVNDENFLMLYKETPEEAYSWLELQVAKAMLLSFSGEQEASYRVLNACGRELMEDKKGSGVLYYTALYITTMINSSDENLQFTKEKFFEATELPEVPWQVVLYRYHMDQNSSDNASIWLTRFKDVFSKGCTSPVIYLESIRIINSQPVLLRVLNSFETQVIRFGYRYGLVEPAAGARITQLVSEENKPDMTHLYCLKKLYDEYNSDEILETLCKKMIQSDYKGPEYAAIYEQAIKRSLNITRLYEYFLMSIDKSKPRSLPERVLRYFAYDSSIDHASRAYLYANVTGLREKDPEIYDLYEDNIISFTCDRLSAGAIDENLEKLYRWLWDNDPTLGTRFPLQVFRLQNTYKITVKSDTVAFADITHPEFNKIRKVQFKNRKTFAFILNDKERVQDSCVICFEDINGRIYNDNAFEYKVERVLGSRRPVSVDPSACEGDPFFLLYEYRRAARRENDEAAVSVAKSLIAGHSQMLSKSFAQELKLYAYGDSELADIKSQGPEVTAIKGDRKDITDFEDLLARMLFTKQPPGKTAPVFAEYIALKKQGLIVEGYCAYQAFLYFVCGKEADLQVIPLIYERVADGGKALPVELAALLLSEATGKREFTAQQKDIFENIIKAFVSKGYVFSFFRDLSEDLELPPFIQDKTIAEYKGIPGREVVFEFSEGRYAGRRIPAREAFNGIYVCELVMFDGEQSVYTVYDSGEPMGEYEINAAREPDNKEYELCRINDILRARNTNEAGSALAALEAELKAVQREFVFV